MLHPVHTLWKQNFLFEAYPYRLNVGMPHANTLYAKNLNPGDLNWVQH